MGAIAEGAIREKPPCIGEGGSFLFDGRDDGREIVVQQRQNPRFRARAGWGQVLVGQYDENSSVNREESAATLRAASS